MFAALFARFMGSALVGKASGIFSAVPRQAWEALAVIGYLLALYATHQQAVRVHDHAIIAAEDGRIAKQALALKARVDALTARIATDERNRNDEQNRIIAADAGALRVSGPGKAVCPGRIGIPAAAGRFVPPGRPTDAAVDPLPDATGLELIGLPFNDAVSFAADHDVDRAEVISWREWYRKLVAAWPK